MKKHFPGFTKKSTSMEFLPERGPMKNYHMKYWYKSRYKYGVKVDGYTASDLSKRFLKTTLGKNFNSEFSKFCKKYSKYPYFARRILDEIEPITERSKYRVYCFSWDVWFIDENGILRHELHYSSGKPPDKKSYKFYSNDYKVEIRDKIFDTIYTGYIPSYSQHKYYETVLSGKVIILDSKKDPSFKRLSYEKIAKYKKLARKKKLEDAEKSYSFLVVAKKEKELQLALNNIILERHGFSEESFHGENYHGRKRKKKRFKLEV